MNRPTEPSNGKLIELPPYYRISLQNGSTSGASLVPSTQPPVTLLIAPGKGFGDGRHATTQLCLLALGYLLRSQVKPRRVLDFGAGNGILGIAAARAGATVEAVEIDEQALAEAKHNAELNGVFGQFDFRKTMRESEDVFELVVANILRAILLDYARALSTRVSRGGYLVLSGLTSTDVPSILACFRPLLPEHRAEIYERDHWRALLFSPSLKTR